MEEDASTGVIELRQWMARYQGGEPGAFDRLYAGLAALLRSRLLALCRDGARADDLLQETFLQIHRARHTYDSSRPVEPWAMAIARHVFLMDCRTRRRRGEALAYSGQEMPEMGWTGHLDMVVTRDELHRALSSLTPGTRRAVVLHHVGGWSFREVGARLGIRGAAAKLRASRGMAALKEWLSHERRTPLV